MKFYVAEVRDSDGNDCTVFDAVIAARDREHAVERLWDHLESRYPDDESDGGYGSYHPCSCAEWCKQDGGSTNDCAAHTPDGDPDADCKTAEGCDGHGGITTPEPDQYQEFETEAEARAAMSRYHSQIDLTDLEAA